MINAIKITFMKEFWDAYFFVILQLNYCQKIFKCWLEAFIKRYIIIEAYISRLIIQLHVARLKYKKEATKLLARKMFSLGTPPQGAVACIIGFHFSFGNKNRRR